VVLTPLEDVPIKRVIRDKDKRVVALEYAGWEDDAFVSDSLAEGKTADPPAPSLDKLKRASEEVAE
jgi:hypothetical protein